MKLLLKLEFAALLAFSIYLFSQLPYPWWFFPVLLLVPDLSMVGYCISTRVGAVAYNFVHHLAVGIIVLLAGYYLQSSVATLVGTIIVAHTSMDRVLGFGLKYPDSFKHTHLGNLT